MLRNDSLRRNLFQTFMKWLEILNNDVGKYVHIPNIFSISTINISVVVSRLYASFSCVLLKS